MIWIVRDFDAGQAMPYVSVWSDRPVKRAVGENGRVWLSSRGDLSGWLGSMWIKDAARLIGVVPDDDVQVIVADRQPRRIRLMIDRINGVLPRVPKP